MPEPAKIRSATQPPKGALELARRTAVGAWICGLASLGLGWAQARWYVFRPHYLPPGTLFFGLAAGDLRDFE